MRWGWDTNWKERGKFDCLDKMRMFVVAAQNKTWHIIHYFCDISLQLGQNSLLNHRSCLVIVSIRCINKFFLMQFLACNFLFRVDAQYCHIIDPNQFLLISLGFFWCDSPILHPWQVEVSETLLLYWCWTILQCFLFRSIHHNNGRIDTSWRLEGDQIQNDVKLKWFLLVFTNRTS